MLCEPATSATTVWIERGTTTNCSIASNIKIVSRKFHLSATAFLFQYSCCQVKQLIDLISSIAVILEKYFE